MTEEEVTWEDQQNINDFGRLSNTLSELNIDFALLQKDYDNCDEAEQLIMMGVDDQVRYRVGDMFVLMDREDAEERIVVDRDVITGKMSALEGKINEIKSLLANLKVDLYAKFGNAINLDA